ncbi:hypothetical protein Tco_0542438 [Tanacetum coccineum]
MQRLPLFENDGFIYWKNRFETYVKSKDLDLWHIITYGDFPPIQNNPETKKDEIVSFEKQSDDLKKKLAKNNEAKMGTSSKWRCKGYSISESIELDIINLLTNLLKLVNLMKVIIKKDSKMVKDKREQSISLALKATKESSDEDNSTSDSEDHHFFNP